MSLKEKKKGTDNFMKMSLVRDDGSMMMQGFQAKEARAALVDFEQRAFQYLDRIEGSFETPYSLAESQEENLLLQQKIDEFASSLDKNVLLLELSSILAENTNKELQQLMEEAASSSNSLNMHNSQLAVTLHAATSAFQPFAPK